MRVGINALGQIRGGTLEHLSQLLNRWSSSTAGSNDALILFASKGTIQRLGRIPERVEIVPLVLGDFGGAFRILAEQLLLPWLIWSRGVGVLFSPASTMPAFSPAPCVVMLQNAAPFLPASELSKFDLPVRLRMIVLRCFIQVSVKRAAAIIFLSETFRRLISPGIRKIQPNDVVLYHARPTLKDASPEEVQNLTHTLGISGPYLLCVSHIYPYKNLTELIRAFGLLGTDAVQLVLVGQAISQEKYLAEVTEAAQKASRFPGQVLLTGGLPHDQVQLLLKGCLAFVFPSTCENCPIGLIEAMHWHVPIACSEVGVMPEIAGNAALLFDPYLPEAIAVALRTLIMDSEVRAELTSQSEHELLRFDTPAAVADATWQVLFRVSNVAG
jgi:glycosyltransferase involved in cell wall biosynthesis